MEETEFYILMGVVLALTTLLGAAIGISIIAKIF